MTFIVATNVVASRPTERQPTERRTRAKNKTHQTQLESINKAIKNYIIVKTLQGEGWKSFWDFNCIFYIVKPCI